MRAKHGGYKKVLFQISKNRKSYITKNWIIRRSSVFSCCFFFMLLLLSIYPACADNSTSYSQINLLNPGSSSSEGYSVNSSHTYSNVHDNHVYVNTSFKTAPLEPEFRDYLKYPEKWESQAYDSEGISRKLGMLPSPVSVFWPENYHYSQNFQPDSDNSRPASTFQSSGAYPTESYFSLADANRVTPVKDQGTAGSCWAYSSLASLDSYLIPVDSYQWDFSENNMKNLLSNGYPEGFDRTHESGGNGYMAAAYLTRWTGPVLESDDSYNAGSGVSPTNKPVQKHVQEVFVLPPRTGPTDNGLIKEMVKEKGGVWVSFAVDWNCYGSKNGYNYVTYYNPTVASNGASSHAVCIIGWDDNFDRNQFTSIPQGNGAFICKNSWGTGSGVNGSGYFHISYYDANLARQDGFSGTKDLYVFTGENTDNYSSIYQYDPLGWTNTYGYTNLNTVWAANIFTASENESLKAVGFYTPMPDINYEISVYRSPTSLPVGGTPVSITSGSFKLPGYHTVSLGQNVPLNKGQSFSIVVKTSSASELKFPGEDRISGYSSKAGAKAGESYISPDGTSWTDLTSYYPNANFCIKGYSVSGASGSDTQAPLIKSVGLNTSSPQAGNLLKITINVTDNIAVTAVDASGSQLALLSGDLWEGTITAVAGTHSVNVSARDTAGNIAWNNTTSYTATAYDSQAPVIRTVSLNTSSPNTGSLIKVSVNATDNIGVISVEASGVLLNHPSGDYWEGTIAAVQGVHSVNVSARDAAGNIAWNNSTSYNASTPGPTTDREPPKINSMFLYPGNTTRNSAINVTVNATDNIGVVNVSVNGIFLKKDGNLWKGSIKAPSRIGSYKIPVIVLDAAGNKAEGSMPCNVVTRRGQLSVSISPANLAVKKGTGGNLQLTIKNSQNIDDTVRVRIAIDTSQTSTRRANLAWFSWNEKAVDLKAGQQITLPLEVKVPANVTGTKSYQVRVSSAYSTTSGSSKGNLVIS